MKFKHNLNIALRSLTLALNNSRIGVDYADASNRMG